jgi:hypothetical protein
MVFQRQEKYIYMKIKGRHCEPYEKHVKVALQ